nr:MAG TPA: hypothetical protein [Caudoviricetes sp.]
MFSLCIPHFHQFGSRKISSALAKSSSLNQPK